MSKFLKKHNLFNKNLKKLNKNVKKCPQKYNFFLNQKNPKILKSSEAAMKYVFFLSNKVRKKRKKMVI